MGTESIHSFPQNFVFWFLDDDRIGVVTNDSDLDSIADVTADSIYVSNKESITQGMMIEYQGEKELLDPEDEDVHNQEPQIPSRLHPILLDYVKAKLYEDKGTEFSLYQATKFMKSFTKRMYILNGGKPKASLYGTMPNRITSVA